MLRVMVKAGQLSPLTLKVQGNLAYLLSQQQHFAEAIPLARDAVERTRAAYGDGHLLVQERRYALAELLWEADQGAEAAAILEDVRRRLLTMSGTETELSRAPPTSSAPPTVRDVLARAQHVFKPGEWDTAHFEFHLGEVLAQEGKTQEARADLSESAGKLRTILGPDSPRTKRALATLASLPSQ